MDKVIIYNPRDGAEINDIYAQGKWKHEVNKIKKYDPQLADYLLDKYGFLQKIEYKDLDKIEELTKANYKCDFEDCEYVASTEKKLRMHKLGRHKISKEMLEKLSKIEDAESSGNVEVLKSKKDFTPEEMEGIPDTKKGDKEGWYGQGWEADKIGSGMMSQKTPGETGTFGAS